ncbi:MAG TPA: isoprenylcysteine carboxylmethyltransferase family protein [Terriglobia bacterium]|nr:isoprenylcysteine carboxylmethyltransferase family protein [Terriglobia bacterium]
MKLALKVLVFTLLLPGTFTVYIPNLFLRPEGLAKILRAEALSLPGWPILVAGAILYLRCAWDFAVVGGGTPAPIDPPKKLVISGLYRHVRNPMYVGVLAILTAEAILARSLAIAIYAALVWASFQLFVLLYEEPTLRSKFGADYEEYRRTVPRWGVRLRHK